MKSVIFQFGSFTVYGYGLMIAIGIILCLLLAMYRAKKYGVDPDLMFNSGFIGIIFGFIGSKITYWLVEIRDVIANPRIMLEIGNGFVAYGGLITGMLIPWIYVRKIKKQTFLDKLDLAVPSIVIAQSIGRIGCYLAGCCYGAEVHTHKWYEAIFRHGVVFPADAIAPAGVELIPTQLISSIGLFLIFLLMLLITRKGSFRGVVTASYMMVYSAARFAIEFLRNDPRGSIGALSTSQFIAIFVFAAGLILFFVFKKKALSPLKLGGYPEEAEEEASEDEDPEEAETEEEGSDEEAEAEEAEAEEAEAEDAEAEEAGGEAADETEEQEEQPETEEPEGSEETEE